MTQRSTAISEIQRLLKTIPDQMEVFSKIHKLESECYKGMDADATRSAVLVSVGLLEYALAEAIGSYFVKDKTLKQKIFDGDREREGIVGTIYSRNVIAYALDIYGKNTYDDINSVRYIRNLCAHAKSEIDFSSEKLKPLSNFHVVNTINSGFGYGSAGKPSPRFTPQSPVHGMLMFLQHLIPYLLLHTAEDWLPINRQQWRAIFS